MGCSDLIVVLTNDKIKCGQSIFLQYGSLKILLVKKVKSILVDVFPERSYNNSRRSKILKKGGQDENVK